MAERGEGFWGIAGAIRCENRVRAANMAQRRGEKRPVPPYSTQTKGELRAEAGLGLGRILQMSGCRVRIIGGLVDREMLILAAEFHLVLLFQRGPCRHRGKLP